MLGHRWNISDLINQRKNNNNCPYSLLGYYVAYNAHMNKEKAIKLAGSQIALAKLLGIKQSAVSQWKYIPQARIWQLKLLKPDWFVD